MHFVGVAVLPGSDNYLGGFFITGNALADGQLGNTLTIPNNSALRQLATGK